MDSSIKLDLQRFLTRAVHLSCVKTVMATHVRAARAHANKQAGKKKLKGNPKILLKKLH